MRHFVALVALSVALATPAVSRGQALAVLGFEPIEVPDEIASQVTQALRHRAGQIKVLRLVPGKPLVELKLVFGCLDEAPACLTQMGTSLGAEKLMFGAVRKTRSGFAVTVKYFDVVKQRMESELTHQVARADAKEGPLRAAADQWFVAATGLKNTATVRVSPSIGGARVFVDDRVIGIASSYEPVTVSDLEPGRHTVRVEARNYKTFTAIIRVSAGETMEVTAPLEREEETHVPAGPTGPTAPIGPTAPTGPGAPTEPETPGRAARIAFWATAGAAVATLAVAGIAAWRVSALGDEKQQAMQIACDTNPADPSCLAYIPNCGNRTDGECAANVPGNDACAAAGTGRTDGTGRVRNASVVSLCDDGKTWAMTTWVLFPLAGAFAIASGYFLWGGYLKTGTAERATERSAFLGRRLMITPVVGPGTTAVAAELRF